MNYTINEIPNEATEAGNDDLGILWQDNKTKKISILNLFKTLVKKTEVTNTVSATSDNVITSKAVSSLLTISASNTTITNAPPLQNGITIRFFFTSQITGSDDTTAMAISYNGTSYSVKATSNGSLKNFTAYPIATEQTRELTKGGKTEEEKGETKAETKGVTKSGTRATVTTYVYCQAYTTLEMMFDGTQFIIMGNPVVISNSDYTVYTDGSITYSESGIKSITRGIENINATTYSATGNYELIKSIENFSFLLIGFECDGTGERTGYTLIPVEICKNRNNINYALVLDMYIGQNNNASAICYFPDTSHIAIYQLNVSGWNSIKLVVYGCI